MESQHVPAAVGRCKVCGAKIHAALSYCPMCDEMMNPRAKAERGSSARQSARPTDAPERHRVTAAIIAICLGWLGAHRFYLGHTGSGVRRLLFFWTGVPLVLGVVEGLGMLSMSNAQFDEWYNS